MGHAPRRPRLETRCVAGNRGFTLIETLIATTVLAVGLIGVAAMLVRSLQASRFALRRSQAIIIAADMAERIRAGRAGVSAFSLAAGDALASPANACNGSTPCTPAEAAAVEVYAWQQWAKRMLPDAQVAIEQTPAAVAGSTIFTITVAWSQSGDATAASCTLMLQA